MEDKELIDAHVELSGFREIDSSSMERVRKIIKNHLRRINELCENIETIHITLKAVHEREKGEKYEVHVKVIDNGKVYVSKLTERSLLTAVDSVLNKVINEID